MYEVEFFISPCGSKITFLKDGTYHEFNENQTELIEALDEQIQSRYPEAYKRLLETYNSRPNYKFLSVLRFIKCNWGKSDEQLDIEFSGKWNLEKVNCPLRNGFCPNENVICNPKAEKVLSDREREVASMAMNPDKEIADTLFLSVHTVENHIMNIKRKLGLTTKGQIVSYAHKHNLIK